MPKITDSGVNVTLGTDNMTENMFHALNFGLVLNRGLAGRLSAQADATRLVALGDAERRESQLAWKMNSGSIEAGKLADLTFVDLGRAHLVPAISPVSNLVHYGESVGR